MSEDLRLSFHREIAASEFGWQADLSDALHADETLDKSLIDKVLLDGKLAPRYPIGTHTEISACLQAAGITMDEGVRDELRAFIFEKLPEHHGEPTQISSQPVHVVKYDHNARTGTKNSRTHYALRVGSSSVALAERRALITATQRFCGLRETPADVWQSPYSVEGIALGRGRSLAEQAIMQAAVARLESVDEDGNRRLPRGIWLDRVESYPPREDSGSEQL